MAFISGIQIINAPASALNNSGPDPRSGAQNATATKYLRVNGKRYPYVSAPAYRRWLRETLEALGPDEWPYAPVFREKKVAYTDGDPIRWCDDDLFGYMRAQSNKKDAASSRAEREGDTPMEKETTITRVTPFRAGTLVALSDGVETDAGYMSRFEGHPVPHTHQFYRASLKGMFSVDLGSVGRFTYEERTGYKNLDSVRREKAEEKGLRHIEEEKAYVLDDEERFRRVATLLRAMPVITGGAKLGVHYTDVSPALAVFAVTKGGNNPFQYAVDADGKGQAKIDLEALKEVAEVWGDTILSPVYIGWVRGYAKESRQAFDDAFKDGDVKDLGDKFPHGIEVGHPKAVFEKLAEKLKSENSDWFKAA